MTLPDPGPCTYRCDALALALVLSAPSLLGCGDAVDRPDAQELLDGGTGAREGGAHDAGVHDPDPDAGDDGRFSLRCTRDDFDRPMGPEGGDFTSEDEITIRFPEGDGPSVQYTNRCAKVKLGTLVTWRGDFVYHPLLPAGGDEPSSIPRVADNPDGGAVTVAMDRVGTFGFVCEYHPLVMYGAIEVVP
jgi:plastocyanin